MSVAIKAAMPSLQSRAEKLSREFHLPLFSEKNNFNYFLNVTEEHIELISKKEKNFLPIYVDFLEDKFLRRTFKKDLSEELLAKAVGIKKNNKLQVWDLTAGWGCDAFLLVMMGCDVKMVERSAPMVILLQDGLERFFQYQRDISSSQFSLVYADSLDFLNKTDEKPDVICLDPMYPSTRKSALVKKEMQILKELLEPQEDITPLFLAAMKKAKKRVVIKRGLHSPFVGNKRPDFQFLGKSIRFDVFRTITVRGCEGGY